MNTVWQALFAELECWRDAGRTARFWWRDDDAAAPTDPLARLIALSRSIGAPLALAVIPMDAQACLLDVEDATVTILQHGVTHKNLVGSGQKKTEFPASEPRDAALARLLLGRSTLERMFGPRALPVLVPPWNRISSPGLSFERATTWRREYRPS